MKYPCVIFFVILALSNATPTNYENQNYSDLLQELQCPSACPKILDPVCAATGTGGADSYKYFHNECLMRYESCRSGNAWTLTQMSSCLQQMDPIVRKECIRPCHFIYDPICATNGQINEIFGNDCVFEMENCLSNGKWIQTRDGACGL